MIRCTHCGPPCRNNGFGVRSATISVFVVPQFGVRAAGDGGRPEYTPAAARPRIAARGGRDLVVDSGQNRPVPINSDKTHLWKADIAKSVDMYNEWFMTFAPSAFRETRIKVTKAVEATLIATKNITDVKVAVLRAHPGSLPTLRMSTCPPIAVDRLIGLAGVSANLVKSMEAGRLPTRMAEPRIDSDLTRIGDIIERMADPDIFVWLGRRGTPTMEEVHRAATIVADRLCGSVANPIIRNAQEKRQIAAITEWLVRRGYKHIPIGEGTKFQTMPPGTFSFRLNVPVKLVGGRTTINVPIDAVIKPKTAKLKDFPLFFEAKSAGDFTNTNKRRKEEAMKVAQLRSNYGKKINFNLFLCGYFDGGYLGYEASEGIDWVWEHRIDDFKKFGV